MATAALRSSAIAAALGLWLAGCLGAAGAAERAPSTVALREPFLKLPFAPDAVPFEPAPADLARRCPELENDRYGQRLWVFARAGDAGDERLVLAGVMTARKPGGVDLVNDHGVVLRLTSGGCELLGPAAEPFAAPEAYAETVPAPQLSALAADAARRYVAAYGKAGLGAAMRAAGKSTADLPPALKAPFDAALR